MIQSICGVTLVILVIGAAVLVFASLVIGGRDDDLFGRD